MRAQRLEVGIIEQRQPEIRQRNHVDGLAPALEARRRRVDVAVGIVDVKSYYIESPDDIAARTKLCLEHAPADRLVLAPDCGLSQTARWAAKSKLINMVAGVAKVRKELGLTHGA